jgi:hypothetical protein
MASEPATVEFLIGIDDTDNLESRGTGFRARELGRLVMENGLGELKGITRHQLHVSPEIPYTSHNSSACLEIRSDRELARALIDFCAAYLRAESAEGSDAGLCVSPASGLGASVIEWGRRAKAEVLARLTRRRLKPD